MLRFLTLQIVSHFNSFSPKIVVWFYSEFARRFVAEFNQMQFYTICRSISSKWKSIFSKWNSIFSKWNSISSYWKSISSYWKSVSSYWKSISSYWISISSYRNSISSYWNSISSYWNSISSYWNQFPLTENQFPLTENKFPLTENQFPLTENQFPLTENQFPPTENQFPLTENQFPLTENKISYHAWFFNLVQLFMFFIAWSVPSNEIWWIINSWLRWKQPKFKYINMIHNHYTYITYLLQFMFKYNSHMCSAIYVIHIACPIHNEFMSIFLNQKFLPNFMKIK